MPSPQHVVHPPRRHRDRPWFANVGFALAVAACFLSLWIVLPAYNAVLLPLAVGAPELSPWLLAANLIAVALAAPAFGRTRLGPAAIAIGTTGAALCAIPLAQLPGTERRMTDELRRGFGDAYPATGGRTGVAAVRPAPFSIADAYRGVGVGVAATPVRRTAGVTFATPDGVPLRMDIFRPMTSGPRPALVVIYGGAWQRGDPSANATFNRYMAERGYVVFAIDYRHAPRFRFPAQVEDVRAALAFVARHAAEYGADVDRLALLGRSAGAHLALLAAYDTGGSALPRVRAVVSYYGPTALAAGYAHPPDPDPLDVRAILSAFIGGSPVSLPVAYAAASPVSYVRPGLPPTLLLHGGRDHVVLPRFARALRDSLRRADVPVALLEIPWAEHAFDAIFRGPGNQLALYHTERFLAWALRSE
jgi:acetyl esterase/lipase